MWTCWALLRRVAEGSDWCYVGDMKTMIAGSVLGCLFLGLVGVAGAASVALTGQPSGAFRWKDVSGNAYSETYQASYNYTQAEITVSYSPTGTILQGTLTATNLKPFFAYQFKLEGWPDGASESNERLGFTGRWWEQEWDSGWNAGWNLNTKGDGSSPNPNDISYLARRDIEDPTSPTSRNYKYTSYRVFNYFITDGNGCAEVPFSVLGCYHVLWKTTQTGRTASDGPLKSLTFNPDPAIHPAYTNDYGASTTEIFGEWERLPAEQVYLQPGDYQVVFLLTEESFHGVDGALSGYWAHAARGYASFAIEPFPATNGVPIWWMEQYGITNAFDAAALADSDEDGLATWEEYYSDTNPTNANSVLTITAVEHTTNGFRIDWKGGIKSRQFIERSYDLQGTGQIWQAILTHESDTAITNSHIDAASTNPAAFYRIRVERDDSPHSP